MVFWIYFVCGVDSKVTILKMLCFGCGVECKVTSKKCLTF
jgi:hypothetical protein